MQNSQFSDSKTVKKSLDARGLFAMKVILWPLSASIALLLMAYILIRKKKLLGSGHDLCKPLNQNWQAVKNKGCGILTVKINPKAQGVM